MSPRSWICCSELELRKDSPKRGREQRPRVRERNEMPQNKTRWFWAHRCNWVKGVGEERFETYFIREEAKLLLLFLVMRCYVSVFIRGIGLIFCFENNDV